MNHTKFLKLLGAPIKTVRGSWGSVREADGAVFLLPWQDHIKRINDQQCARITFVNGVDNHDVGTAERNEHIELIRKGATCYLVVCIAKDLAAPKRTVKEVLEDVFLGGEIIEHDNDLWIEMVRRIPGKQIMLPIEVPQA